ncbi:MAG TPA: trigger factor [Synechococcales cyanobacterium M55_K2018_004]|nr:trigger factor [Synechococcales cyanobacterium M55_K2018_004]
MKVTQEKLPASRVGLEIEITPEMSQQAYEKTVENYTRNANIPGFRKGKVPRQIVLQRFGSRNLKAIALEELIENTLKQAIEQEKIDALGNFELKSPFEDLVNQFEPGSAITFTAVIDVPPEANLTTYTGLTVQAEEVKYDPSKVDEMLENYRERRATHVPVEGRPAREKDLAVVDFKGVLVKEDANSDEDPQEIPGGSAQDFEVELVEGRFIPGFIDGIIGMSVGETKEVHVTFPDPYVQPDLAGKPAIFTITLKELKEKELPELDDDFAQEISEFETMDELRKSLEERFQKEADDKTRANKEEALLNELVKHLDVDLPATLVNREVDYMVTQLAMQFSNQGVDIKKMFTAEIVQDLKERSRPEAISRLKRTMALGEIAKKEGIKVEEEAIATRCQEILTDLEGQDIDQARLREVVEEELLKEAIFAWLENHNTIELVPEGTLTPQEDAAAEVASTDAPAELPAADAPTVDIPAEKPAEETVPQGTVADGTVAEETVAAAAPPEAVEVVTEPVVEDKAEKTEAKSTRKKKTESKPEAPTEPPSAEAVTEAEAKPARKKTTKKTTKKADASEEES